MDVDFKEACRLFWLTKGHLNTSKETIMSCYDGYFRRLWGNNERAVYGMEGFEEAYKKRISESESEF
tara:strand:- start:62 stop:262 length:201 start_codon:yes stop_codon:yes gene_type:complete